MRGTENVRGIRRESFELCFRWREGGREGARGIEKGRKKKGERKEREIGRLPQRAVVREVVSMVTC